MKIIKLMLSLIFFLILLNACKKRNIPLEIEKIIKKSNNESALFEVLDHYSKNPADSLKLKAAFFLVKTQNGRSYFTGQNLEGFMKYPELVLRDLDHGEFIMSSLSKLYGDFSNDSLKTKYDLQEISSDQMIANIDQSFIAWERAPWHLDYTFDQFCEFILPFRINNEVPSQDRKDIYEQFIKILDTVSQKNLDAVLATKIINDVLIKDGWILSNRASFLPNFNAMTLINNRIGTCRDMGDLAIYVMRSVGLPVAIDFVPQWPYRSIGHNWNVVIDKHGVSHPFLGAEDSPGTPHKARTKRGKIYRRSVIRNEYSLAALSAGNEVIPMLLDDPYLTDVTDLYVKTHNVDVKLPEGRNLNKTVYLCVFNNKDWVPVAWSKRTNNNAKFTKMEGGIVYLPAYLEKGGFVPATHPIELDTNGVVRILNPDTLNSDSDLICDRIYPTIPESFLVDEAIGSVFEGANNKDFSDAIGLYKFKVRALPYWNDLNLANKKPFRYYRYLSSKNRSCQLSELQFYNEGKRLRGKLIADEQIDNNQVGNVEDGNISTSFRARNNNTQIMVDFGKKIILDKIRLIPRLNDSPNEHILPGQTYELSYWDKDSWIPIRTEVASTTFIRFRNLPSNSLFILRPIGRSNEYRIFTNKNSKQEWF